MSDEPFWSVQLNTKTIGNITAEDLDTVFDNVNVQESNVEAFQALAEIKKVAGFVPGSPWKGTASIKAITLTGEGSDNKETIHRPDPGQVWMLVQSSIEVAVQDTGQQNYRILTYDGSNFVCHIEYSTATDSLVQEPILNEITTTGSREGGFNNPIYYDYDNYLVCYADTSGSFTTDPVVNSLVVRVQ